MAPRQLRSLIAVPLLLASMAALTPTAAQAGSDEETFVTIISEPGDPLGDGLHRFFDRENGSITLSGDASHLTVRVSGGNYGADSFQLEFAAPWGEVLQVGEYERAQFELFRDPGRAGIEISGNDRGCGDGIDGWFRVNEITTNAAGAVTSVWIVYEQFCESPLTAVVGEVRVNVPGDGGKATIGPREFRWRPTDPDRPQPLLPVVIRNTSATDLDMTASSLSGPSASELDVRTDECAGETLAPGAMCEVVVEWTPGSPGDKSATLLVPEVGGPTHALSLEGHVYSGRTRLAMTSDEHDWIGQGKTWSHTPADSRFAVGEGHNHAGAAVLFGENDYFGFTFQAPAGESLTPGTTYMDSTWSTSEDEPRIYVGTLGRGCQGSVGEFTIHQLEFDAHDELERLSVSFDHYCDNYFDHGLHGILEFRATVPDPDQVPDTTITSGPSGVITARNAEFGFAASVQGSRFECSLDGSGFQTCTSPSSYQDLTEGSHTFRVRAKSPGSQFDPTPAERTWTVDAAGPLVAVLRPTAGLYVNDQALGGTGPIVVIGSVTVQASASDAESGVSTVGFDVNGTPVDPASVTREGNSFRFTFRPPSAGQHTITVRATNGSGLPSSTTISLHGVPAG